MFKRIWRRARDRRGFTLIELMVVLVIIGIIAGIALPRFMKQADKARTSRAEAELKSLKTILDVYGMEHGGKYPGSNESDEPLKTVMDDNGYMWDKTSQNGLKDPWGNPYKYKLGTGETSYTIWSDGPDGTSIDDDIVATDTQNPAVGWPDGTSPPSAPTSTSSSSS